MPVIIFLRCRASVHFGSTKLYCLVTAAHTHMQIRRSQLAKCRCMKVERNLHLPTTWLTPYPLLHHVTWTPRYIVVWSWYFKHNFEKDGLRHQLWILSCKVLMSTNYLITKYSCKFTTNVNISWLTDLPIFQRSPKCLAVSNKKTNNTIAFVFLV